MLVMDVMIPFECDKTVNDFKLTSKGFYCGDCQHHIIDLRNSNGLTPEKGSCVIIDEETLKPSLSRKITYRFALTLFLVMGSSLIINNSLQANNLVEHFNSLKEQFITDDTTNIILSGEVSDEKGRSIKPVKVTVELSTGEKIEEIAYAGRRHKSIYNVSLPKDKVNELVKVSFEYFDQVKTMDIVIDGNYLDAPTLTFKRSKKDRFSKKRYPKRMFVGKFKF